MGWLDRFFDTENGGTWMRVSSEPHKCPLPKLTKPIEWRGGCGTAGFEEVASDGDLWACKCGQVWGVERLIAVPPGYKGGKTKLKSGRLSWRKAYFSNG